MLIQMRAAGEHSTRSRGRTRRAAIALLARAFPGRVALLAGLAFLTGALPAAFALLVATLVATLPAAVGVGLDSADGRRVAGALAAIAGVLLVQEVVGRHGASPRRTCTGGSTGTSWRG